MKLAGYLRVAILTTINIVLNALTLGRFVWLEGRVTRGTFRNWARRFRYRPPRFAKPATEAEVIDLVRRSRGLRVFGSGHSFNAGVVVDGTLVSLDRYTGVIPGASADRSRIRVRGGTRVRDVSRALADRDLAFSALPSHDAQSIGGILATDVHGTGREWGFVSEHVTGLKVIDGRGEVHECAPSDDLFKAAIGGIGAVGIISEVELRAVPRFNVRQQVRIADVGDVERDLDELLAANEHLSLYLFPFTTRCQVNTWSATSDRRSFLGGLREFIATSVDAGLAAWFGNLIAYLGLLPRLSALAHGVKRGTNLVLESNAAFNRTIYHLHQELEFTVPFEDTFPACRRFLDLYEGLYRERALPYGLLEVRFTPAGHDRALIGPGRDRRCTWIDLVLDDSPGFERYYAAAQELMKEIGARPHLGKFCEAYARDDLAPLYGEHWATFERLVKEHDPEGRFANEFTRRFFA